MFYGSSMFEGWKSSLWEKHDQSFWSEKSTDIKKMVHSSSYFRPPPPREWMNISTYDKQKVIEHVPFHRDHSKSQNWYFWPRTLPSALQPFLGSTRWSLFIRTYIYYILFWFVFNIITLSLWNFLHTTTVNEEMVIHALKQEHRGMEELLHYILYLKER